MRGSDCNISVPAGTVVRPGWVYLPDRPPHPVGARKDRPSPEASEPDMGSRWRKTLGILALCDPWDGPPPAPPTLFQEADWFGYPSLELEVAGATAQAVVTGTGELAAAYVEAARRLERAGAAAITADCGFSIVHQRALCGSVSVPVATSSLLLLPSLLHLLPQGRKLGLLTFDAGQLGAAHLRCAGVPDGSLDAIVVKGIEGSRSWHNWMAPVVTTEWEALERDVMGAARTLAAAHPDIGVWLLECTGFPAFRRMIRAEFGQPVFDWVSLCDLLMGASAPRPA